MNGQVRVIDICSVFTLCIATVEGNEKRGRRKEWRS